MTFTDSRLRHQPQINEPIGTETALPRRPSVAIKRIFEKQGADAFFNEWQSHEITTSHKALIACRCKMQTHGNIFRGVRQNQFNACDLRLFWKMLTLKRCFE